MPRWRILRERPDAILADAAFERLIGIVVRVEGLLPHGRAILVIDDLQLPAFIGAGEPLDVDLHCHAISRHPAG